MRAMIAAFSVVLMALVGCADQGGPVTEDRLASFDGGVLRVRYPTDGNEDILVLINRDGSVADVIGGANSVSNFKLSRAALTFDTEAVTTIGRQPMKFTLDGVAEGSWVGDYTVGGDCSRNCLRTGAASWDRGGELISLPDA